MTGGLTISVVIVSRDRPAALHRCLLAVSQLCYPSFELVVVADRAGVQTVQRMPQSAQVKLAHCAAANAAQARNQGIALAAGQVVAFLDDDAVPEPTWLTHLAAAFADPRVALACGFVRGPDGLGFESRARVIDGCGQVCELEMADNSPRVLRPPPGQALFPAAGNMALRRDALVALGGFDTRLRWHLGGADLALRLAAGGGRMAVVPRAELHHARLGNHLRRADGVPRDLHEHGADWAVFLDRHCPPGRRAGAWSDLVGAQRRALLQQMVDGRIEPRDLRGLMASLTAGHAEGLLRADPPSGVLPPPKAPFRPFPVHPDRPARLLAGWSWQHRQQRADALREVAAGHGITILRLSPTPLYHRVSFTDDGFWQQTGGVFGKSSRADPWFRPWRFGRRVAAERARIADVRGLPPDTGGPEAKEIREIETNIR